MEYLWKTDWARVFSPQMSLAEILVRSAVTYGSLCLLLRAVLKRQAGKVALSDLLVVTLVAGACRNPLIADDYSLTDGVLVVAVVLGWSFLLDWLSYKLPFAHRILHPSPRRLIKDGKILNENLESELMTDAQLRSKLRRKGVRDPSEVAEAWIEGDGQVSIIKRDVGPNGRSNGSARREFLALACDCDGTLTQSDHLAKRTVAALERWRASGRKLILVTGETPQQLAKLAQSTLFDLIVAEDGALLFDPHTKSITALSAPRPPELLAELEERGVEIEMTGQVIVATTESYERDLTDTIRHLGIPWRVDSNRKKRMALPADIDKAVGLAAALRELKISAAQVVGIGDGENDVPLLDFCGYGVAVHSAVPTLKDHAATVAEGGPGAGVVETISKLLGDTA